MRISRLLPALLPGLALALLLAPSVARESRAEATTPPLLLAQSGVEALQRQLTERIEQRDYAGALSIVEQIRAITSPLPASVVYAEGFSLLALGRAQQAELGLAEHLRRAGPGSQFYDELAQLYGAARRASEQERVAATASPRQVPQAASEPVTGSASQGAQSGTAQSGAAGQTLPSLEDWPEDQPRPHDPELLKSQAPDIASEWELRTRADARKWMHIRYSRDPEVFRRFLADYPDSRFVGPARKRYDSVLSDVARRGYDAFSRGDYQEAHGLWLSAAEQGNDYAQTMLGLLYDRGLGVPEDPAEAYRWYAMAAEQGNSTAATNLGVLCYDGRGVPQDSQQALDWLGRAADQGEVEALYRIGVVFQYGKGNVPQDLDQARQWFRRAAERGSEQARQELMILGG